MLVRKKSGNNTSRVKFISYTGEYPNLCSGVLTLEIDGKIYKFGHDYRQHHFDENAGGWRYMDEDPKNPNFDSFWTSGGHISEDYETHTGEWEIDVDSLPEQFWDIAPEIDEVFNKNVEYGCCGGCI